MRSAWLQLIGLPSTDARKNIRVCGRHFARCAFLYDPELMKGMDVGWTRLRLKPTALPTLFLPVRQAQMCRCIRPAVLHTVGTQKTAITTSAAATETPQKKVQNRNTATQAYLNVCARKDMGTQTDTSTPQ